MEVVKKKMLAERRKLTVECRREKVIKYASHILHTKDKPRSEEVEELRKENATQSISVRWMVKINIKLHFSTRRCICECDLIA